MSPRTDVERDIVDVSESFGSNNHDELVGVLR
jgi:hypothetical protein